MIKTIYLAGGCFWGLQKLLKDMPGVAHTTSGYANGSGEAEADYDTVCMGYTGFRETVQAAQIDPGRYPRPEQEVIREKLSTAQYAVTQQAGTEPPFDNAYWDFDAPGIYVDVVTGEPLFTSKDKFESSCGWPAFSAPIEAGTVTELSDTSFGMVRTEVRSRSGNSHLGHVFRGPYEGPAGVRYCINSAALRFVPFDEMEEAGYGWLKARVADSEQ